MTEAGDGSGSEPGESGYGEVVTGAHAPPTHGPGMPERADRRDPGRNRTFDTDAFISVVVARNNGEAFSIGIRIFI